MLRTIDLFSGAGGLSIGFRLAGFECVAAVEVDKYSVQTYAQHTPSARIFDTDVRRVSFAEFRGAVDVVVGGPPCQPFSSGGLRKAQSDERDMVPEFIRAVSEIEPAAFIMENVPGLTVGKRQLYLSEIVQALAGLGYEVSAAVLQAEEYGVPQKRRRLFIVGVRTSGFVFPAPTHGNHSSLKPFVCAGDVLTLEPKGEPNPCRVYYARRVDLRPSPHHGLLFNGGGRAIDLSQPAPTIISSAGGNKTHFIDTLGIVPEYHAHLMSGGAPREGVVPGCRRLTTTESAILQTFPDDVVFAGPKSAQYRQIGNAVPPLLARAVATAVREHLEGRQTSAGYAQSLNIQYALV